MLRSPQQIIDHIDEGVRQLHQGEYTEYDEKGLGEFVDDVQAEGRKGYEAQKKSRDSASSDRSS
jgi:hypothetical protein